MIEKPRAYQQAIFETAKKHNTLVVLPTGLGKTLIALLLAAERLKLFPDSKVLFLAPTRPLVEQHYHYFKKRLPYSCHIFTGKINAAKRAEIWKNAQLVFSTPQCIHFDLEAKRIDLEDVVLLIEDEAHRCLKNYSYTYVAKRYLEQAKNARLLGLTASPASEPAVLKEICSNLGIDAIEIRTRESPDVRLYLHKLSREIVKVELSAEFKEIRELLMALYKKKIEELRNRNLLFGKATKKSLLELQKKLHRELAAGNRHYNILRGLSVAAQVIKLQHALELLETQTVESCYSYLEELQEQAKEVKSKAVKELVKSKEFVNAWYRLTELQKNQHEHPKLEMLKELVMKELKTNPKLRAIIFANYRDTINQINDLLQRQGISVSPFIGQAKSKLLNGMSQKEQQLILHKFKQGELSCLIASSIGEEGLDIPEVDLVIFYEPIASAIRQIQRRGRTARLKPGKLIILMTKGTRDESYHWAAFHKERKMYGMLESLKKEMQKRQKRLDEFSNLAL